MIADYVIDQVDIVNGLAYCIRSEASYNDDVVRVRFRMTVELRAVLVSFTTTTISAKRVPLIGLRLVGTSSDGNYTLDATAGTHLFNSKK